MSEKTAEDTTTTTEGAEAETQVEVGTEAAGDGTEGNAGAEGDKSGETPDDKSQAAAEGAAAEDEVVVTIGDQAPPQEDDKQAPAWVKELRKTNRELARQNRDLQKKLEDKGQAAEVEAVGPKPKLSDFDYDSDKYDAAMDKWHERKRAADDASARRQRDEQKAQEAWQEKLNGYGRLKTELKVKDFDEVEAVTTADLDQTQQAIIVSGADNSALVMYALGKNPTKLKELAAIKDPVKFAFAVAKLEKDLKVTTRKAPPPPEKQVTGSAPNSGVVDSQLDKLRAEAERTGDYTKVTQYKRQKRAASA